MEATLAALKAMFGARWSPEVRAMFAANDLQALMALMSARENWGLREILETSDLPCLLFGGELDAWFAGAEACATQMRNATAVSLPGLDHIEVQFRPELVLPHILAFLRRVDASS
jgi:pimeloyl-ACP methyl ester carboxylesterase